MILHYYQVSVFFSSLTDLPERQKGIEREEIKSVDLANHGACYSCCQVVLANHDVFFSSCCHVSRRQVRVVWPSPEKPSL